MRFAIDPRSGIKTSIEDFLIKYGNDANDKKVFAQCFVCRNHLRVRSPHNPGRRQHFAHMRNTMCPTVAKAKSLFEGLRDTVIDPAEIHHLKMMYRNIMPQVYLKCRQLADKKLGFKEFISINEFAARKDLWNIRHLKVEYIPYILLSYRDLTRKSNPKRLHTLRFIFVREIHDVSLLWMWPTGKVGMVKLIIEKGGLVDGQMLRIDTSLTEHDWLTEEQKQFLIERVSKVIGLS